MLPEDLNAVDERSLLELCAETSPERQTLDFKRDLPGRDNRARSELPKDVCALANADGGDLIYGVEEKNGAASGLTPITVEPPDAAIPDSFARQVLDMLWQSFDLERCNLFDASGKWIAR